MRITRIFTQQSLSVGTAIELDKSPSQHINKVLRLKVGSSLELFNGDGNFYSAKILKVEKSSTSVHILDCNSVVNESPLKLHLFQGVSRGDKMDLTLQKGVELGVSSFTPIITERCGVKLDHKRWQKKHEHWQKVIQSACEQSGRNIIPQINQTLDWKSAVSQFNIQSFFLHPDAKHSFTQTDKPNLDVELQLWVGPEGGFSDNEVTQIERVGGTPIKLGPRVLRTETAALAAVSAINVLWGDF